ncbi:hypothetical protein ACFV3R_07280 [Streptomyces sp. NPDC059740]|uniref:hypothetical protein n=1 Tax=Streptomyces sp. NPDC059740 TaxID=3346926 RepID=UPI00364BB7FF
MGARSSGVVTALTAAAVATVGVLAYQASASAPAHPVPVRGKAIASPSPSAAHHHSENKPRRPRTPAVPAHSGTGERVVYDLGARRVWLVGADGGTARTYEVTPSTVDPVPGSYTVTSRTEQTAGSDGVPIEHVVVFASVGGVTVGFSAAVDGSTPSPDPARKTGGIRESRADGAALWKFAAQGTKVLVLQ